MKSLNILFIEPDLQLSTQITAEQLQLNHLILHHTDCQSAGQLPLPAHHIDLVIQAQTEKSTQIELEERFPYADFWTAVTIEQLPQALSQLGNVYSNTLLRPYQLNELRTKLTRFRQGRSALQQRISQTFARLQQSLVDQPDRPHMKLEVSHTLVNEYGYTAVCFHMLRYQLGVLDIFIHAGAKTDLGNYEAFNADYRQQLHNGPFTIHFRQAPHERKPILWSPLNKCDTQNYPIYKTLFNNEGWQSALLVPIQIKDEMLGVMVCYKAQPDAFNRQLGPNEQDVLQEFANLVAVDHNNWRQFRKWQLIQEKTEHLAHVYRNRNHALDLFSRDILPISETQGATVCYFAAEQHRFLPEYQRTVGDIHSSSLDWANITPAWDTLFNILLDHPDQHSVAVPSIQKSHIPRVVLEEPTTDQTTAVTEALATLHSELYTAGIRAMIIRKLDGTEDPVGVAVLFYSYEHVYADLDVSLEFKRPVTLYLNQFAIVLSRCRQSEHTTREFEALLQFSQATHVVSPAADISENLWQQSLRTLMRITGADRAIVGFIRSDWGVTQYSDTPNSFPPNFISHELTENDTSPIYETLQGDQPIRIRDFSQTIYHPTFSGSALYMPIHKAHYSIIFVLHSHEIRTFDKYDEESIVKFADFVSMDSTKIDASGRFSPRAKLDFVRQAMQFTAVQPIRADIQLTLNDIHTQFGYDLIHFHPYTPESEQIGRSIMQGRLEDDVILQREIITRAKTQAEHQPQHNAVTYHFASDCDPHPYFNNTFLQRYKVASSACVTFFHAKRPLGWLFLHTQIPNDFNVDAPRLLPYIEHMSQKLAEADILPRLLNMLCHNLQLDGASLHIYNPISQGWDLPVRYLNGRVYPIPSSREAYKTGFVETIRHLDQPHRFAVDGSRDPIFQKSRFLQREEMKATGYVHLVAEDLFLGVLFVNRHNDLWWTETEEEIIRIFAQIAEVVIRNKQQLQQIKDNRSKFDYLRQAAADVVVAGQNLSEVVHIILRTAMQITRANFGTIRLVEGSALVAHEVWGIPQNKRNDWFTLHQQLPINTELEAGVESYTENDLTLDAYEGYLAGAYPDGFALFSTRDQIHNSEHGTSTLVLLIPDTNTAVARGTITIKHTSLRNFTDEDTSSLKLLANLASFALSNAQRLSDAQTTETLAWSGLFGSNWWHDVAQKSRAIDADLTLLQRLGIEDPRLHAAVDRISSAVEAIESVPARDLLPKVFEKDPVPLDINRVLTHEVNMLLRPHPHCIQVMELAPDQAPFVKMHDSQFRILIEKLVKNGLDAMNYHGRLVIRTRIVMQDIEIQIEDNGPGIPNEILPLYLKQKTPSPQGSGIGGLIAKFICQRSGGQLRVLRTGPEGTCLSIFLPLATAVPQSTEKVL